MPDPATIFPPTFHGQAIFGTAWVVAAMPNPNDRQFFAPPGVNGMFSKNLGSRGGRTVIHAMWLGETPAVIAAAEQILFNFLRSGLTSVFTDLNGSAWPHVCIETYVSEDEVQPTNGGWGRSFTVTLFHHA